MFHLIGQIDSSIELNCRRGYQQQGLPFQIILMDIMLKERWTALKLLIIYTSRWIVLSYT
ncbi:MAG: hypothetical protein U9N13_05520 [Euryarchaeota archaeon]|nr:hypothetical protein [Euryarchaeota archaeon]